MRKTGSEHWSQYVLTLSWRAAASPSAVRSRRTRRVHTMFGRRHGSDRWRSCSRCGRGSRRQHAPTAFASMTTTWAPEISATNGRYWARFARPEASTTLTHPGVAPSRPAGRPRPDTDQEVTGSSRMPLQRRVRVPLPPAPDSAPNWALLGCSTTAIPTGIPTSTDRRELPAQRHVATRTARQWAALEGLLPTPVRLSRPSLLEQTAVGSMGFGGGCGAGSPGRDLPRVYGSWAAAYGLFRRWQRTGTGSANAHSRREPTRAAEVSR
jgi:hypothetical protein